MARNLTWTGATSTDVGVASNYTDGTGVATLPPDNTDSVFFLSAGASGGLTLTGTMTAASVSFGNPGWIIQATITAATFSDAVFNSVISGLVTATNATVGYKGTLSGTLDASAGLVAVTGGSLTETATGVLKTQRVSVNGGGSLIMQAGASLTASGVAPSASIPGEAGQLNGVNIAQQLSTVTGATLNSAGTIVVSGTSGTELDVAASSGGAGATVTSLGTLLGAGAGQAGILTINGAGTTWHDILNAALAGTTGQTQLGITLGTSGGTAPSGTGTLTVGTGAALTSDGGALIGAAAGSNAQATVQTAGTWSLGNTLSVGTAGTGVLQVLSGGQVKLTEAPQAANPGIVIGGTGTGSVLVSGKPTTGAASTLDANNNGLSIGQSSNGTGTLTINQGGIVNTGSPGGIAGSVGAGGNGTLALSDAGSALNSAGYFVIGQAGTGTASVRNGAALNVGVDSSGFGGLAIGDNTLGYSASSGNVSGGLTVSGTGSTVTSAQQITVGRRGNTGALTIGAGGTVTSSTADSTRNVAAAIGYQGDGTVMISGTNAVEVANGFTVIGRAGQGAVTVQNGGLLTVGTDTSAAKAGGLAIGDGGAGFYIGGSGTLTVGTGGAVRSVTSTSVGNSGNAGHVILSGGALETNTLKVGDSLTAAAGTVVTDASDTTKTLTAATTYAGNGVVDIGSGSQLTIDATALPVTQAALTIGAGGGSAGIVNVAGSGGAALTTTGAALIGNAGTGALNIGAGGTVNFGTTVIGQGNIGTVTIGQGGSLATAGNAAVGGGGGSGGSSVIVNGAGAKWTITGALTIGSADTGTLSLAAGGTVTANLITIGGSGVSGTVTVTGNGSDLISKTDLNINDGVLILGKGAKLTLPGNINGSGTLISFAGSSVDPAVFRTNLSGAGTFIATDHFDNHGLYEAFGGVMDLVGPAIRSDVTGTGGTLQVDANGTLQLEAAVDGSQTIVFDNGAASGRGTGPAGTVILGAGKSIAPKVINNFRSGDIIQVEGYSAINQSYNATTFVDTITDASGNVLFNLQFASGTDAALFGSGSNAVQALPCFAAGTRIKARRGEVRVEDLREGDEVWAVLARRYVPVTWIGHRTADCTRYADPALVHPVRVEAGAFGQALPVRDLFLSPDHAVFCDDVLVPVKYLLNGTSVRQVARETVTYYHVKLARHDVLLAEGMPAESFLADDGQTFGRPGEVLAMTPDFGSRLWAAEGCAEACIAGPMLDRVRARIAARASRTRGRLAA